MKELFLPKRIKKILAEIPRWEYSEFLDSKVQAQIMNTWMHAVRNVPYYSGMQTLSWNNVPILKRQILNDRYKDLLSLDRFNRKFYENSSGGSSGQPVKFVQDKSYDYWNIATKIHYKKQFGQNVGDLECRLWGSERDLYEGKETLKKRLTFWLYNRKDFNAFKMSKEQMSQYARWIKRHKPKWIEAYVDAAYEFAKFCYGEKMPSPRGVLVSAGTLHDYMAEKIGQVFNCPVVNRYGSREVGGMACTCKKGSIHVSSWMNYIEILDEKLKPVPEGEMGKVYVTNLRNFSMPLIRYDIGDLAIRGGQCDCGRKTPVIAKIIGRESEVLRKQNGEMVSPVFFSHLFGVMAKSDYIDKVQVIQEDYNKIKLKIVPNYKGNLSLLAKEIVDWFEKVKEIMGEVTVNADLVDELEYLPSGKCPYVMNKIGKPK